MTPSDKDLSLGTPDQTRGGELRESRATPAGSGWQQWKR